MEKEELEEAEYVRRHKGEQWPERGGKRVPSLAPADRGEARGVAGMARAVRVDITQVRNCVQPRGTGDVWDEGEGCGAAGSGGGGGGEAGSGALQEMAGDEEPVG